MQRNMGGGGKKRQGKHGEGRIALTAEVVPLQHSRCIVIDVCECVRAHL